jgi:hypothetical protein
MPDPMSRKLFMSRNAREKLRGMGGIMASSPELAQTVAQFAEGGPTELQIPRVRSAIQEGGISYPSYLMMSRSQREALGYPVSEIGGQLAFDRFGVGLGLVDPASRFSPSGLNVTELESELRPDTGAVDEFSGLPPYMTEPSGTVDIPQAGQGIFIFPGDIAYDLGEAVGFGPALKKAGVEDPAAERAAAQEAERAAAQEAETAPEIIEQEVTEDPVVEPEAEDVKEPEGPGTGTAALTDVEGTGAAIGRGDFDTTYEQMLSRLQNVMGTEDKGSREKAMANLAMIGLAIAAGQSPNALTNIAQGALVGMKGIQEAEAAETAREREMRLEAMRLAAEDVDLRRRLESQERIAGMRGTGGGTYTPERLYQQNLNAILGNPDMFDVFTGETVDPLKVRQLATSLSERGMSLGGAGDQQYTPGQLVVQDGVTYEYQQDGTWQPAGE